MDSFEFLISLLNVFHHVNRNRDKGKIWNLKSFNIHFLLDLTSFFVSTKRKAFVNVLR